jgi:hypothetical protein
MVDLNSTVQEYVHQRPIPIFGIARAGGFEHALPGWHPRQLMPRCNSVVVFGRPFVPHPYQVDEKTHLGFDPLAPARRA